MFSPVLWKEGFMKKKILFALVLFSLVAVVSVFAFEARNGTFGGVGTNVTIKFWTDGNVEMSVSGTTYALCGRWTSK